MSKFLKNIIVFVCIGLVLSLINIAVNSYIIDHYLIIEDSRVLVIGDSYTERGINPDAFDSANNIAQSAEPYKITFWKLKTVLKKVQPDTLILGFSHHNISEFNDFKLNNSAVSHEMFKRYYPIFKPYGKDHSNIDKIGFYKTYLKQMALFPHKRHFKFIGKHANSKNSNISDSLKVIQRHYYNEEEAHGVSKESIRYLDSIISISKHYNIKLLLVNCPVHKEYAKRIPEVFKNKFQQLSRRLENEGIQIYDFSNVHYTDSLYLNADHLNELGAKRFTKSLLDTLQKH